MLTYTFKTANGEIANVRACDTNQARILAMAFYGKQFYDAKLVKASNSL